MPAVVVGCAKYQMDSGVLMGRFNLFLLFFLSSKILTSVTVIMFMAMLLGLLFSFFFCCVGE